MIPQYFNQGSKNHVGTFAFQCLGAVSLKKKKTVICKEKFAHTGDIQIEKTIQETLKIGKWSFTIVKRGH